jgi:hypothetical protein
MRAVPAKWKAVSEVFLMYCSNSSSDGFCFGDLLDLEVRGHGGRDLHRCSHTGHPHGDILLVREVVEDEVGLSVDARRSDPGVPARVGPSLVHAQSESGELAGSQPLSPGMNGRKWSWIFGSDSEGSVRKKAPASDAPMLSGPLRGSR